MSELASALFSIADANEFRFARFYIVCEAVPLGTPESPPIVCGLPDTSCGLSKRGKDTEYNVKSGMQEIHVFCSNDSPRLLSSGTWLFFWPQIVKLYATFHVPSVSRPPVLAVASSPDVHLLRLFDEVVAEIRMRDRDQSLGSLPGRQTL